MSVTSRVVRKTFIQIPNDIKGPTVVKAGFPAGQSDQLTVNKAIWNEFGTRGGRSGGGWGGPIPERPFMRNAARNNLNKYLDSMRKAASQIVVGKATLQGVLNKLGIMMVGDIQSEISSGAFAPNSPVTIERKGSSRPLVDSGEMRQKVTYKVDK